VEHVHFKEIGQSPNGVDNNDSNKDIDGNCTFYQFINIIEKYGNKKDIDKINYAKIPKFEFIQG
jgi:hypothetical protein